MRTSPWSGATRCLVWSWRWSQKLQRRWLVLKRSGAGLRLRSRYYSEVGSWLQLVSFLPETFHTWRTPRWPHVVSLVWGRFRPQIEDCLTCRCRTREWTRRSTFLFFLTFSSVWVSQQIGNRWSLTLMLFRHRSSCWASTVDGWLS